MNWREARSTRKVPKWVQVAVPAVVVLAILVGIKPAPAESTGFEFHGVKSGMTQSQIRAQLGLDSALAEKKNKYPGLYTSSVDEMVARAFAKGLATILIPALSQKAFTELKFLFTDEGLLWRLDVYFPKPRDPAKLIALDRAMKERFKGWSLEEESKTISGRHFQSIRVIMIDEDILNKVLDRYTQEYLQAM